MNSKKLLKKYRIDEGNLVRVECTSQSYEGYVLPVSMERNEEILSLKLRSGYNIGVGVERITSIKKLGETKKVGKAKKEMPPFNESLPTISILHIGGTISGRVDYRTGAITVDFDAEDLLTMYPELQKTANFKSTLIGKMWSEDMRFRHYTKIAKEIEKEVKKGGIGGIILPHGTDTMTYTAAALSFMLENLPVPVILVGSQRSSDRGSTDAAMNLICACEFITKTDFAGVAICMHEGTNDKNCSILPPTKTRKLHTSRRDAFRPVNSTAIARVNYETSAIEFMKKDYERRGSGKKFVTRTKIEEKVALLKSHPNMMPEQILFYKKSKYKGLVLEGTGLGQIPIGVPDEIAKINRKNLEAMKQLIKSGCIVVMTSQCIFGRVQMHVYEDAVDLVNIGVIPGEDMLSETAFVKLAWLLANFPKKEVPSLMKQNLRGEISDFTIAGYSAPKF